MSFGFWSSIILYWSLSAILDSNSYLKIESKDAIFNYRSNTIGLIFPVTDTFYNKHFYVFFITETIFLIFWAEIEWVFDILMISVCICIEYQLKTIADSYSSLGLNHNESKRELNFYKYMLSTPYFQIEYFNSKTSLIYYIFHLYSSSDNNQSTKSVEAILDLELLMQDQQNIFK